MVAPGGVYGSPAKGVAIGRLCSADLPELSAFYDKHNGLGYKGRLRSSDSTTRRPVRSTSTSARSARRARPSSGDGLVGGKLYGLRVPGLLQETDATFPAPGAHFELVDLGDVSAKTGAQLQADSTAALVTKWQRPEDGAWHPRRTDAF